MNKKCLQTGLRRRWGCMLKIKGYLREIFPSLYKKARRWKKKRDITRAIEQKKMKPVVNKQQLKDGLITIGLKEGTVVLVHSGLSQFGPIKGGAKTVVEALLETIGPEGTLAMPAYPMGGKMSEWVKEKRVIDFRTAPSKMGAISEYFRSYPGIKRSIHPTHSVCALGPKAEYLVKDHGMTPNAFDKTSPFYRLIECEGNILHLGSAFRQTTSFHVIEDICEKFPIKVYWDNIATFEIIDMQGNKRSVQVKVHDPQIGKKRGDVRSKKHDEIFEYCRNRGVLKEAPVGNAPALLLPAKKFEESLETLLENNITIYEL